MKHFCIFQHIPKKIENSKKSQNIKLSHENAPQRFARLHKKQVYDKQKYEENPEPKKEYQKQYEKEKYFKTPEAKRQYERDRYGQRTDAEQAFYKERQKQYRELRKQLKRIVKYETEKCPAYCDLDSGAFNENDPLYDENYLGPMNVVCKWCKAKMFEGELINDKDGGHFNICCHNGKVNLDKIKWPKPLADLFLGKGLPEEQNFNSKKPIPKVIPVPEPGTKNTKENPPITATSTEFLNNTRTYNNSFAFASTSITLPEPFRNSKPNAATTFVKVQGL